MVLFTIKSKKYMLPFFVTRKTTRKVEGGFVVIISNSEVDISCYSLGPY